MCPSHVVGYWAIDTIFTTSRSRSILLYLCDTVRMVSLICLPRHLGRHAGYPADTVLEVSPWCVLTMTCFDTPQPVYMTTRHTLVQSLWLSKQSFLFAWCTIDRQGRLLQFSGSDPHMSYHTCQHIRGWVLQQLEHKDVLIVQKAVFFNIGKPWPAVLFTVLNHVPNAARLMYIATAYSATQHWPSWAMSLHLRSCQCVFMLINWYHTACCWFQMQWSHHDVECWRWKLCCCCVQEGDSAR